LKKALCLSCRRSWGVKSVFSSLLGIISILTGHANEDQEDIVSYEQAKNGDTGFKRLLKWFEMKALFFYP
jgi:peptide methionine sulfoxide reductase MsrA